MKIPFTDLQSEYQECKWEIDEAIKYCLENNSFITGPDVAEFEQIMSDYTGAEACSACGSGTTALQISLKACGIGRGDEVITVSHTFVSTPEAVCTVGATPVFCDVNIHGLIDIKQAESLITKKTKAILWVDLYGQTPDCDKLVALCKKYNLYSIADSAQAFGYKYNGRRVGSLADLTCISFNPVKNLGAIGDAGCVTGRRDLVDLARYYSNHGRDTKYVYEYLGYNARIDNIQAKVVQAKLPYLQGWLDRKHEIATYYTEQLQDYYVTPKEMIWGQHSYYVYVMEHPYRDKIRFRLGEAGIGTNIHYANPAHLTPAFKKWRKSLPVTEQLSRNIFSIPNYPHLTDSQVEYIADKCKELR